ncbi:contactin 1b isoform X2 [Electrophorus electricus]|nr:contactin 1b isoform X2 [Electrophorus electricus]
MGITMAAPLLLLCTLSSFLFLADAIKPRFFEPRIFDKEATGFGPIFEEEPLDTVYAEDSPEAKISMNCRVRANPPATIKWWHNNWEIKLMEQPDEHYSLVGGNLVITNPDKGKHAGKYVCVAKNIYGTVISKEAIVKFGFLDQFPTDEREAVYIKEGQGAVLLCTPPTRYPTDVMYRWIYNDFPNFIIPDQRRFVSQTTGNLYIAKVEVSDIGNYSCFVSSPSIGKSVFSTPIPLVPQIEKEVKRYPADIRVRFPKTYALVGQNVTLECFALGNPLPHVRWRKLDADLPPNYEVSMNGALLHLINVQYEDEGSYECEALNVRGMDWYRQWLYVEGAPEWAEHINDTEKDVGSELTLSCTAVGKPLPWIRWLKDGYSYGKGELKFSSLTFEDSGMYQCVAENNWGTIYANAELRVVSCAPTFIYNPVKRTLLGAKNGRVVIECKPRAAPKPRFIWKRGSQLLTNSSRMFIWDDGSLEILNVTKNDEGSYTCYAENDRGKDNSTGILSITEATEIIDGPSDVEVSVGGSAVLPCSASYDSSLDITFIWSVDSYVINFATDFKHYEKRMNQVNRGDLLIKDIQITHAGQYICTAQTIVDNATAVVNVFVKGRPGPPGWVRVEEVRDTSVKLVWNLGSDHGSPLIQHVIQTRDFYALDPEDWKTAVTSPVFLDGKTETAEVTDLYPWMEYEFRAYAINELGAGESSLHSLKIKTWDAIPAMSPTDVHGYVGVNGELIVTWTPMKPQYFFGKKFGYVVMFKTYEEKEWHWSTVADPEARRFVYRDRLIPNTEIEVKVKGYNSKGEGPFSLTTVLFSSDSAPSEAPLDVYARQVTSTEALVWWLPVYQVPPHWVDGYQIRYWRKYDDNEASASRVLVSSSVNKTRLENMRPDSHYLIEVRAYNGAGLGPPSEHCEMFTRRAPPNRRLRVYKYVSYDRKWLYIYWDHIYNYWNESYVEGYKILYRKEGERYGKVYTTGNHYFDLPMPETGDYVVEIRPRCEGGDGLISQIRVQGRGCLCCHSLSAASLLLLALAWMTVGL